MGICVRTGRRPRGLNRPQLTTRGCERRRPQYPIGRAIGAAWARKKSLLVPARPDAPLRETAAESLQESSANAHHTTFLCEGTLAALCSRSQTVPKLSRRPFHPRTIVRADSPRQTQWSTRQVFPSRRVAPSRLPVLEAHGQDMGCTQQVRDVTVEKGLRVKRSTERDRRGLCR